MLIKDYQIEEKPREKFKLFGPSYLTDVELFAVILNTGTKEKSVIDLSRDVLKLLEDCNNEITLEELTKIKGVGEVKAIKILSIIELSKRLTSTKKSNLKMNSAKEVYNYLKYNYLSSTENFVILYFNNNGKFIKDRVYSNMKYVSVDIDENEIIKWAIKYSSNNIIIAHNHPSGVCYPSDSDFKLTKIIAKSLKNFKINLLDHIIFTEDDFESIRYLNPKIFE